jgi:hypothetical protein
MYSKCVSKQLHRLTCPVLAQGVWLRDYRPMPQRPQAGQEDAKRDQMGIVKPSNAYRRRVAGVNWQ